MNNNMQSVEHKFPINDTRRMAFRVNGADPFARQFPGTTPPSDHLVDVKTLGAGQAYHSNSIVIGKAVETRQGSTQTTKRPLADTRYHCTPLSDRGPFVRTLHDYGDGGPRSS